MVSEAFAFASKKRQLPVRLQPCGGGTGGGRAKRESGRAKLLRSILTAYFTKHAPEGLARVEDLVARVVRGALLTEDGRVAGEAELFEKLEAKYGAKVDLDPQAYEK